MTHNHLAFVFGTALSALSCGADSQPEDHAGAGASSSAGGQAGATAAVGGGSGATASAGSAGAATGGGGASAGTGGVAGSGGTAGAASVEGCSPPKPEDMYTPIPLLSKTGCVDASDPKKFVASAVTYQVNSPLWSDNADKSRAFVLPTGKKIHVRNCAASAADCAKSDLADDGRWDFPVGSVMIKIFMVDGKLVETRLFMHMGSDTGADAGWVGYSYQWNEAQTDATIVPSDRQAVMFNTGKQTVTWHYPSRQDCMDCHNKAAGFTLGPETAQMNRVLAGTNQIDALAARNLFDVAPTKPYKAALVTPYPVSNAAPAADATVAQEARSYLHANCAFCHRPGGMFDAFDLRYDTALADSKLCGLGTKGQVGSNPSLKILSPGTSADSLIIERMSVTNDNYSDVRMPQIGSYVVDGTGVPLVQQWIDALPASTCL
ncbi:MAG: hypothetical protein ABJB12_11865 [Pseudomonadota bacterium]